MNRVEGQGKALSGLFLFGAIVGSVFDGFHTFSGTTFYPHPVLLKMAWWVPLLFGVATVIIARSVVRGDRWFGRAKIPLSWGQVGVGLTLFGLTYFASGFLPPTESFKLVFVLSGAVLLWVFFDQTWQGILLGAIVGLVGSGVEIALIRWDLFHYTHPDLWGIPYWLPLLYFAASIAVGNLGRKIWEDSFNP